MKMYIKIVTRWTTDFFLIVWLSSYFIPKLIDESIYLSWLYYVKSIKIVKTFLGT